MLFTIFKSLLQQLGYAGVKSIFYTFYFLCMETIFYLKKENWTYEFIIGPFCGFCVCGYLLSISLLLINLDNVVHAVFFMVIRLVLLPLET